METYFLGRLIVIVLYHYDIYDAHIVLFARCSFNVSNIIHSVCNLFSNMDDYQPESMLIMFDYRSYVNNTDCFGHNLLRQDYNYPNDICICDNLFHNLSMLDQIEGTIEG